MQTTRPVVPDPTITYTRQNIRDNTLDNAQLEKRCPLDNGRRRTDASMPTPCPAGQLDQLPAELIVQILLYCDLPSLSRLRRVSLRAMELVESVPQYAVMIKHCPDIVRAVLSIQADAFSCNILYTTLSSSRCSTCKRFGDHLYLINCRRVCYSCFTERPEYLPLTINHASKFFTPDETKPRNAITGRQRLLAANVPSVLSLPGRYCVAWGSEGGILARRRLHLFDRQAVVQDIARHSLTILGKKTRETRRFMAIITAPYLFDHGRQADWGYFCLGCENETDEVTRDFRIKYTAEEVSEHIAVHGPVMETPELPGRLMHVTK